MIVDRMWSAFGIKPCCVKGIRDKMKNIIGNRIARKKVNKVWDYL